VLRYKYRTAVTLGSWVVECAAPSRFHVTASVVSTSEPWVSRVPLDLYFYISGNTWIWEGVVTWRAPENDDRLDFEAGHIPTIIKGEQR